MKIKQTRVMSTVADQNASGIDMVADGEERREHYVLYNLRHLGGIDFTRWKEITIRGGARKRMTPVVTGTIAHVSSWLVEDFKFLKARTKKIAKMTLPGKQDVPLTFRYPIMVLTRTSAQADAKPEHV